MIRHCSDAGVAELWLLTLLAPVMSTVVIVRVKVSAQTAGGWWLEGY